ncbi:MAG: hypothetical protein R3275_11305 [Saprospiraceae bacterium]|nr:hypothetical protein [Saprospiraceae bacterium]
MKDQQRHSVKQEVGLFLDRNLSQSDQKAVLNKVKSDPSYRATYNREKNVRELLKNSVQRSSVSPDLIKSIKNKIKLG